MFINVILTRSFYLYFVSECREPPLPRSPWPSHAGAAAWPRRRAEASSPEPQPRPDSFKRERRKISPIFFKAPTLYPLWTQAWLDQGSSNKSFSTSDSFLILSATKCCDHHQVFKRSGLAGNRSFPKCRTSSRSALSASSPSRISSSWGSGTASSMNTASGALSA